MPKNRKSVILRISPEMQKAIEKWAADEFRSMNGQLEWIIHKALKDAGREPKQKEEEESGK